MGVRFACHACGKRLNIKQELAGKRGICPECSVRFRIPLEDTQVSTPLESTNGQTAEAAPNANGSPNGSTTTGEASTIPAANPEPANQVSSLDILTADPTSTWYVRPPNGGQYGPATGELLKQWIAEGRVATTALLWREGWPEWREASEALPEMVSRLPKPDGAGGEMKGSSSSPSPSAAPNEAARSAAPAAAQNSHSANRVAQPQFDPGGSGGAATAASQDRFQQQSTSPRGPSHAGPTGAASANGAEWSTSLDPSNATATAENAAQQRSALGGDDFGYEDSVFASNQTHYGGTSEEFKAEGRDDLGKVKRTRNNRRTLSIVVLGMVALGLIAALIYFMPR